MCPSIYVVKTQNTLKKRMEQHLKYLDQKVKYNKNPGTVAAYFDQHFNQNRPHNSVLKLRISKLFLH